WIGVRRGAVDRRRSPDERAVGRGQTAGSRRARGVRVAREGTMSELAKGTFEVTLTPGEAAAGGRIARLAIDKIFRGDLDARSQGEMISASTAVKGSAVYSAIEWVTGS